MGKVGVVMGSYSDFPKLEDVFKVLKEFGVPYEARILSAHRTPKEAAAWAADAEAGGIQVVIAAAGGAAHLAGSVAAHTILPVIGVPVVTEGLGGLDSLLSTVQMPAGVPVATVAAGAGGPANAALLAVQILARSDVLLAERLREYKRELAEKVHERDEALRRKMAGEVRT